MFEARSFSAPFLGALLAVLASGWSAACGSCGAPDRVVEPSPESDASHEAWGARFDLPPGWTGGQNETGGYEYTDGDIALLIGHHALEPTRSLDDFFDERRRSLVDLGELSDAARTERKVGGARALSLSARATTDGGALELRLLVVRLGPGEAITLMMVGDASGAPRLEQAWNRVIDSVRLP